MRRPVALAPVVAAAVAGPALAAPSDLSTACRTVRAAMVPPAPALDPTDRLRFHLAREAGVEPALAVLAPGGMPTGAGARRAAVRSLSMWRRSVQRMATPPPTQGLVEAERRAGFMMAAAAAMRTPAGPCDAAMPVAGTPTPGQRAALALEGALRAPAGERAAAVATFRRAVARLDRAAQRRVAAPAQRVAVAILATGDGFTPRGRAARADVATLRVPTLRLLLELPAPASLGVRVPSSPSTRRSRWGHRPSGPSRSRSPTSWDNPPRAPWRLSPPPTPLAASRPFPRRRWRPSWATTGSSGSPPPRTRSSRRGAPSASPPRSRRTADPA